MATLRAPSPRYREDDPQPAIQLQPDDIEILWHVYANRVMDAKSIQLLFPNRSEQVISRRLNLLRKGPRPYLRRLPQAPNRLRLRVGSDPFAYALAGEGAVALRLHRGIESSEQRWKQKNREIRPSTIAHELAASRFMARLWRDALAVGDGVKLYYQDEIPNLQQRIARGTAGLKNTLRTHINGWNGYRQEEGTAPDRIFAIGMPSPEGYRLSYFFLEMDEGTETIAPSERRIKNPSFWRDTSLLRKFVIYASAFETKAHKTTFGMPHFRVITITTSSVRAAGMRGACCDNLPDTKPGLFLFSDWEIITAYQGSLINLPFLDAAERDILLLDTSRLRLNTHKTVEDQ